MSLIKSSVNKTAADPAKAPEKTAEAPQAKNGTSDASNNAGSEQGKSDSTNANTANANANNLQNVPNTASENVPNLANPTAAPVAEVQPHMTKAEAVVHGLAQISETAAGEIAKTVDKVKEYIYSTPLSERFGIHLSSGEVRANNSVLKVNEDQHKEIQDLIKSGRPDIAQNAVLLDPAAAEKIALAHIEKQKLAQPMASRGATSTMHTAARMQNIEGHEIPNRLADLDVKEEAVIHADDSNLNPDGTKIA